MWKPKEIIVHKNITDDPATKYFLNKCPDIPVKYVADSKSKTIKKASTILKNSGDSMLGQIQAGKQVVFIAPATKQVDEFQIEDRRILCPCFPRLKLAFNGCYYNCDWCYLKLTYRAQRPYITVKVQYDKIKNQLQEEIKKRTGPVMFNSGELGDSLALDHLTGANKEFIPWFGQTDNAYLFMLSKSDNVDEILDLPHNNHTILTWSINNENVARKFEIGAPTIERRLNAAAKVQNAGYPVRIRLDPVIPIDGWQSAYAETVKQVFDKVSPKSITIGTLRFETGFYAQRKTIFSTGPELESHVETMNPMFEPKLYPGDKKPRVGKYSFPEEQRIEIFKHIIGEIKKYSDCPIALCKETSSVWKATGLDTSQCSCVCQFEPADMSKIELEIQENSIMEIETKPEIRDGIEYHKGTTKILLIAPHGVVTPPLDDKKTAELTREIQNLLKCDAIINPTFRKPKGNEIEKRNHGEASFDANVLDLNNIGQAEQHPTFLPKLKEIVDKNGATYVFWIHGIDDNNIKDQAKFLKNFKERPDQLHALIGYGQGPDRSVSLDKRTEDQKADSPSIEKKTAERFAQLLTQNGMNTELTSPEATDFCARSSNNMNQWFLLNGYKLEQVRSLQLEIREEGFRTDDKIKDTAKLIADAISTLLPDVVKAKAVMGDVVDEKVEKAYEKLALIFSKNYEQALMEAGQYIVRTFYGGEHDTENKPYDENFEYAPEAIENARNNKSPLNDSLHRLYVKISDESARNTPSQAWVYNAVRLVIQWHDVKKELKDGFYTYRNLLLSHKISLLTVKNIQEKLELIHEVSKNDFTALSFKKRIADSSAKAPSISTLLKNPQEILKDEFLNDIFLPALQTKRRSTLSSMKTLVEEQSQHVKDEIKSLEESIEKQKQYLKGYDKVKSKIENAIESKDKKPKKKPTKAKSEKSDNPNP